MAEMNDVEVDPFKDDEEAPNNESEIFGEDETEKISSNSDKKLRFPILNRKLATVEAMHVRVPFSLGIRHAEFDPDGYGLEELEEEQKLMKNPSLAIRWKFKRDEMGNIKTDSDNAPIRESNARLVRKTNGTFVIMVGSQEINFNQTDLKNSYIFNVSRHSDPDNKGFVSFLEGVTQLNHRAILTSSNLRFEAKKKVRKVMTEKELMELESVTEQEARFRKEKKDSNKDASSMSIQYLEKKKRRIEEEEVDDDDD